jgi:UDP-3-O-[3-hydroxymyristoyl] glucosamine N-acyltransferase
MTKISKSNSEFKIEAIKTVHIDDVVDRFNDRGAATEVYDAIQNSDISYGTNLDTLVDIGEFVAIVEDADIPIPPVLRQHLLDLHMQNVVISMGC